MIDTDSVETAYRFILGREPESRDIVERIAANTQSVQSLRQAFMSSAEFYDKTGIRSKAQGRFEAHSTKAGPRILIISNCQGPEIARHLAAATGLSTVGYEVVSFDASQLHSWYSDCDKADFIFSIPLGADFEGLRLHQLKERYPGKLVPMSAPFFAGLFPDIVTLGSMNQRIHGPMDSHSGLALKGYLSGISVDACVRSFNGETFERLGYFDVWEKSKAEFLRRESDMPIRMGDEFFGRITDEALMVSHNHPTVSFYQIICKKLCEHVGVKFEPAPPGWLSSFQVYMPVWPIENEVAKRHGLKYRTPLLYGRDHTSFDRRSFIERSYDMYKAIGKETLLIALRERQHWIAKEFAGDSLPAERDFT